MEGMFTMAYAAVKKLPLEEQFPPDTVERCHETRDIPCFNDLSHKDNNAPQVTIDLVIERVGLPNHILQHTEPSEVQYKLPIWDERD